MQSSVQNNAKIPILRSSDAYDNHSLQHTTSTTICGEILINPICTGFFSLPIFVDVHAAAAAAAWLGGMAC